MAMIRGIQSMRLYELLGAPMVAMVKADAQAARATVDFIEAVGFTPDAGAPPEAEHPRVGRLRMAELTYSKVDERGEVCDFSVSVPLLSLMPIPSIQIKQAKVGLAARITGVVPEQPPGRRTLAAGAAVPSWIASPRIEVLARPVASTGARGQEVRGSHDLDIEITLGQADITTGVEKILDLLGQAIHEQKSKS
ncbi:MAG: DUF2589 domain-containing protein [Polyangiaceae bacterium]|nr:DUF2589 domain-containing protein [Polyangiaceae bacterium]